MIRRIATLAVVLVAGTIVIGGCGSKSTTSTSTSTERTVAPPATASSTSTTPAEPITEAPATATTPPATETAPSEAEVGDAICASAYARYKAYEAKQEQPEAQQLEVQVEIDRDLLQAATELRDAGVVDVADALERQADAGRVLARALAEGQFDTTREFSDYEDAGKRTAAVARELGAPECERLGGI